MIMLENLGCLVLKKRGDRGIRTVAKEIGVSPSTLSRIENGHLPDLEDYRKICRWLGVNSVAGAQCDLARVHFKKDGTTSRETAAALAELILAAQRALELQERD